MDLEGQGPPLGALTFGHLLGGRISCASGGRERRYRPGDVFLCLRAEDAWATSVRHTDS